VSKDRDVSRPEGELAAVLFDLDGLLVDSEPLWTVAEREIAEELGGTFTPTIKAAMIGQPLPVSVPILLDGLGTPEARAADPDEVAHRLLGHVAELFADALPLQPGALSLLDAVAAAGVPAALVSSSYRELVDTALVVLGAARFAVTVAGDEVSSGKPAPDPYLMAAERLAVAPQRCVVLEDSAAGMHSALAAGCACLLVPTFEPGSVPAGVVVRASLGEVDLELLAALVAGSAAA
jgi:HAD superfamily hydrolase (TIGR01509 family)